MKAQVFYEANNMRLEDVGIPQISADEVLIKVKVCGICGSDISYFKGISPVETAAGKGPLILGHELSGEIVEIGDVPLKMSLFKIGDKVTVNPPMQCNACEMCSKGYVNLCEHTKSVGVSVNGGFAEYVKVRYTHVYKLPESISFEEGALIEPFACSFYGVKNLSMESGDFVVVFGPGAIGLMMVQLIKMMGARKVALCGIFDYPLEKGAEFGADYIFNTLDKNSKYYTADIKQSISQLTGGRMAERVIVPTNAVPAMQQALEVSAKHGTVVFFGLPGSNDKLQVPMLETLTGDKTFRFSWLAPQVWPTALKTLSSGKIRLKELITNKFDLESVPEAITFMGSNVQEKIKGIISIG